MNSSNQTRNATLCRSQRWLRSFFVAMVACALSLPCLYAQQIIISKDADLPKITGDATHSVLILPEGLIGSIRGHYPNYRFPTERDLRGQWARQGAESFPFIVWGNLTGNGSTQIATILIGEDAWMLVILEKHAAQYDPVFVRGGTINKSDSRIGSPQELSLQLLPKGREKVISVGGKTLRYKFPFDAIQFVFLEQATYIIHFEKGEYEEISVVE